MPLSFSNLSQKCYNERRYSDNKQVNLLKVGDAVYRNVNMDHFMRQEPYELGKGGNSVVQCYTHIVTDTTMALKRTRTGQVDELHSKTKITRDIEHLRKLRGNHNIITLYGYFSLCGEAVLCMEKMETCFAKIRKRSVEIGKPIPTRIVAMLCHGVSSALVCMKDNGIIHRDIKPANMLLSTEGRVKLSDFGGSGFLYDSYSFSDPTMTNCYAAPERIDQEENGKKAFDCTVDVWSLGVSALELATGRHPFASREIRAWDLMQKILHQPSPKLLPSDPGYSEALANFIANCLEKLPVDRLYPKLKNGRVFIMKHKFISLEDVLPHMEVAEWYRDFAQDGPVDT